MSISPLYSSSAFGVTGQDNLSLLINLDQNSLGQTSKAVATAVRHLCGLFFHNDELKPIRIDDYYEVAKDYYERIRKSDPTGRQSLMFLSYVSAYFHEIRHVHDLLATSYGQTVLFKNLNLFQNTPILLAELGGWQKRNANRPIPLPIIGNLDRLPGLDGGIVDLVNRYARLRDEIEAIQRPADAFHSGLSVTHLLECSATNIQLEFVSDVFGLEAFFDLVAFIQSGKASRFYLQIINEMLEIFYAKGFRGHGLATIINYLLWCSLFGTTFPDKKRSEGVSIVALYEALAEHVIRKAGEMELSAVRGLVLDFCDQWGFHTPEQMVSRVGQELVERADKLEAAWKQLGFGDFLVQDYRYIVDVYHRLNRWIADHAESYFGHYVWAVMLGTLPSVRVLLKLNGSVYHLMSPGYQIIPSESWEEIIQLSATLKMLLEGRSQSSSFAFIEDNYFSQLVSGEATGIVLRFKDAGPLFAAFD